MGARAYTYETIRLEKIGNSESELALARYTITSITFIFRRIVEKKASRITFNLFSLPQFFKYKGQNHGFVYRYSIYTSIPNSLRECSHFFPFILFFAVIIFLETVKRFLSDNIGLSFHRF